MRLGDWAKSGRRGAVVVLSRSPLNGAAPKGCEGGVVLVDLSVLRNASVVVAPSSRP